MSHSKIIKKTINSNMKELKRIEHLTCKIARELDLSDDEQDNLSIAVTEAVGNAILHGNKKTHGKKVDVVFKIDKNQITVSVKDEGKGFNPDQISNPLAPNNLLKESGRGIFILKTLMDDVSFSFSTEGTTISFVMNIRDKKS
ncbi:ATP-binding protein [bacterium]|nr:ATP-binding protein [bacterium]